MRIISRMVICAVIIATAAIAAAYDIPALSGRITDNAGILSAAVQTKLDERLKAHETRTGNQIAVLTVPSLNNEDIEGYAEAVFKSWKLGRKGRDNGILIIVVPQDRAMRIEVGYGLEGTLPDSLAGSIIRNEMAPKFKNNDYDGGIEAGVNAVLATLENGKTDFETQNRTTTASAEESGSNVAGIVVAAILFFSFPIGVTWWALVTPGGFGWFLYALLIPLWAVISYLFFGTGGAVGLALVFAVMYPFVKKQFGKKAWYRRAQGERNRMSFLESLKEAFRTRSSGRTSSDSSSIGSSDSSDSDDFSGGGGSSGGGGASGSW